MSQKKHRLGKTAEWFVAYALAVVAFNILTWVLLDARGGFVIGIICAIGAIMFADRWVKGR